MSVRRLAEVQPEDFAFTPENEAWAQAKIAEYPEGRQASAVIPVLWQAQLQNGGWLPEPAIRRVADMLEMPYIRVYEIATFYTMFQLAPVGRIAHIQVCGTTPCMLRGAEDIVAVCRSRIAETPFTLSGDGGFSWEEVECAGACVNAPMVQVGPDTYEDLTVESFERILDAFAAGERPEPGPQSRRQSSEPVTGATTLLALADRLVPAADDRAADDGDAPASADSGDGATINAEAIARADGVGRRPPPAAGDASRDDLQAVSGIGPKIAGTLDDLGIVSFDQIAAWTAEEVAWIDGYLAFKGRVEREDWIGQAKALAAERGTRAPTSG